MNNGLFRFGVLFASCFVWGSAGTPPAGFSDRLLTAGFSSPTAMSFAPDGRLFVAQQNGTLRVVKNEAVLATPFLNITVDSNGERGLLGVDFDPDFVTNQWVYVYYTTSFSPKRNRVSRFTANGDVSVAGSEVVLLELENLTGATNHNGGALHFGADGKLYIAVGDNAIGSNAQTLTNKLGKILRMNKDGSVPTDNPFFSTTTGTNRLIWTLGLRNPYTFAFQPGTARMFINDVGQNTWEEINDSVAGNNFGWPTTEGSFNSTSFPNFTNPFFSYNHSQGCAITGGDFYNPPVTQFPATYTGQYFYADFCSDWIRLLDLATKTASTFVTGVNGIVDIRTGPDGGLYYLERGSGQVRVVEFGITTPLISRHPQNVSVAVGFAATFSVIASGGNLAYQWQRNNIDISTATGLSYPLSAAGLADTGAAFRVRITNSAGTVTSNPATLTVVNNQLPVLTIATPAAGSQFEGGQVITFSGSASDPETGALPLSAYRWRVDYHTGAAVRPFVQEFTGAAGGSWTVPNSTPYTLTDVFFRIYFTARDSQGFENTVTRDVAPRISNFSLVSQPAGLSLTLDGQPFTAPLTVAGVVGLLREVGAPSPQQNGGTRNVFLSWSDAQPQVHNVMTPAANATYAASFQTQYLLSTVVSPAGAGTLSGGGWFNAGSTVNVNASPAAGWQLTSLSGAGASGAVLIDAARTVIANFEPLPGFLMMSIVSKQNGPGAADRVWTLRVSNSGQGPVVNARLSGVQITLTGPGPVSVSSALPLAMGTIAAGASRNVPLGLVWPVTSPVTRARMTFTFLGDFGYTRSLIYNNLFR